jgi:plastocyanin
MRSRLRARRSGPPQIGGLVVALFVALLVAGGATACSNAKKTPAAAPVGVQVQVKVFAFQPTPLKIKKGATVTWSDEDDLVHTVTSGKRDYAPGDTGKVTAEHRDGVFDITLDGKGKKGSISFPAEGTFHYFCARHPGMEADVVVQP